MEAERGRLGNLAKRSILNKMENQPGPEDDEIPDPQSPQLEPAILAAWRRILAENRDRPITPAEAVSLIETSLAAVAQGLQSGEVQAFQDQRGRIRIDASITCTAEGSSAIEPSAAGASGQLWEELQAAREELAAARAREARMQEELEVTEMALQYTKTELANLWRVMTTRNLKRAARNAANEVHEGPSIISLAERRARISSKVNDVREIARRRRWPWSLVG